MGIELAIGAAIVGAAASTAGGVYSVVQGERAERDAKRAGRARAEELRRQAEVERERGRRLLGAQRAAYGAAGVDPGFGSPVLVQGQAFEDTVLDIHQIMAGARNVERDARAQGRGYRAAGIAGGLAGLASAANFAIGGYGAKTFTPATESVS